MKPTVTDADYKKRFIVPEEAIDANGHVNNVVYVHWMQDLAIQHWESLGGSEIEDAAGCTWVARSHQIEYLKPAFKGDQIEARTWIANIGRARSLRKYSFKRVDEDKPLARGQTDWVFVDVTNGRPRPIPSTVRDLLPINESNP